MMLLKTLPQLQESFDHVVCCIRGRGPIGQKLTSLGIPVYYLDLQGFLDWHIIPKFHTLIQSQKPDLLVTYLIHADLFGRIFGRIFGIKKIFCSVRVKLVQAKYLPLLILDGLTSFLVDQYHFNSQSVADLYQKYFFLSKRKITIIENGLDITKYEISMEASRHKRHELHLDKETVLGCLAKLRAQKGHKYLLEAFHDIHTKYPETVLLLIGNGEERQKLEILTKKLQLEDSVIFLGNRDDVPELLSVIDIFVFPTLFEGMSNALMEAMANGIPIIATDIPENRELIVNGVSGLLVPKKNSLALTKAIKYLLTHKEKAASLAQNARKIAVQNFALEKTLEKYRVFFQK